MVRPFHQPFWYYEALEQEEKQRNNSVSPLSLNASINAEVCIVGGGYTGLWTALQLKSRQPDLDIVIIDKGLCGSGASGRNGGCMLTWSAKYFSMKKLYGEVEAARLIRASEQALFHIRDFCISNNINAELRLDGALYTATNQAQTGSMTPLIKELKANDLNNWECWPPEKVQKASGSKRHLEGCFSPVGGSVQPGLLVRGLRHAAVKSGVRIYENTPMLSLVENSPAIIKTPNGSITSNKTVLAINAWMPTSFPAFNKNVVLVSSDMAITPPVPELLKEIGLVDGKAIVDSRTFVHYYRSTPAGRLMFGKGGNMFAFNNIVHRSFDQPSRYHAQLRSAIDSFFPALRGTKFEQTWTGPSDRSATGLPFFGYLNHNPDIVYGLGYSGNGVGQTYIGGQFLSSMVLEEDNEWTRSGMAKGPLGRFPPEPVRWIGAMTVRSAIRRKERAEDAGTKPLWIDNQLAKIANAAGKADKG